MPGAGGCSAGARSKATADALPDYLREPRCVPRHVAHTRSFDHFFRSRYSPVDVVLCWQTEFTDELALRSPVPFAEWMCGVQLAEIIRRALRKLVRPQAA